MDAVDVIKSRLTMPEVISRYGFEPKKRMKCPLHNGDDLNFSVTEKTFTCFSHCGSGDVITFVQKYFNISFPEALRKIDTDFGLFLYGDVDLREREKSQKEAFLRKKSTKEKQKLRERAEQQYWAVFDELKRLEDNKEKYAPKSIDENPHPLFLEALRKISHQEYLLDCAERIRKEYE